MSSQRQNSQTATHTATLLGSASDPNPIEIVNAEAQSPLLLVCEHAGRAIPSAMGSLGLSAEQLGLHIAYDIGAEILARDLAERFQCRLIVQRYSRLVIDCNRPPGSEQSIPVISDHVRIPGNAHISDAQIGQRQTEIFQPYADAAEAEIARPIITHAFSVHSFTPVLAGVARPWDIGFLYRRPASQGERLFALAKRLWPELTIGDNNPYGIDDDTDWFIPVCAEPRNIPHSLIEVRNDHLLSDHGRRSWGDRLYNLLSQFMEQSNGIDAQRTA